ncbi:peptidase S28 [Phellopilus nigrolimitatus]|nr:peptidase S28 [Phellopilus nigrolimitatus]
MLFKALNLVFLLATAFSAQGQGLRDGRAHGNIAPAPTIPIIDTEADVPVTSRNGTELPPYNTTYYFDQLIDHNNPSLGTFKQRYWHTYEFYEPGGPIILFTPGEANAAPYTGYLTNVTINGLVAQQQNGSTIVLEHRFYGLSNPYDNLSVASFRVHTIQQAINDLVYFAQNVKLPMPDGSDVTPDKAPWVLIGGSYSGALTAWTMVNKPDVFFTGYASSAVVESITDFWQYFDPIRQFMPKNCSADVQAVIASIDATFSSGTQTQIDTLKNNFGLGSMSHLDDVAGALRNNLWDWQSLSPTSGPGAQFFDFCDALEVKNGVSANESGWGVEHALTAWGAYWNASYYELVCGDEDAETCLGTYNSTQTYWTNTTIDNAGRSWEWIVCNEVGFFQEGAPIGTPTVVTRLVQPAYDERQCTYWFPEKFKNATPPDVAATNKAYDGWDLNVNRLFFANGQRDPWRDATVSSDFHTRQSTSSQPIAVGDGFHCSDLSTAAGKVDTTILAVQEKALALMKTWLSTWSPTK